MNKGNAVKSNQTEHVVAQADRQKARALWAKNRLAVLDGRLGMDIGATRERARLFAIINPNKKGAK